MRSPGEPASGDELISVFPLDLFGEPIRSRAGLPGRPRHVPTAALRQRVSELRGQGLDHHAIAGAIGLTAPTLRLNYAAELGSTSITGCRRAQRDQEAT